MFTFHYGYEGNYVNVTDKVNQLFENNLLQINGSYNELFSDHVVGMAKNLKIESSEFSTVKVKEDFPFTLSKVANSQKIKVVYFINTFVATGDYSNILEYDLQTLNNSGLAQVAEIYVETSSSDIQIIDKVKSIIPHAQVSLHENCHEYPGIKKYGN